MNFLSLLLAVQDERGPRKGSKKFSTPSSPFQQTQLSSTSSISPCARDTIAEISPKPARPVGPSSFVNNFQLQTLLNSNNNDIYNLHSYLYNNSRKESQEKISISNKPIEYPKLQIPSENESKLNNNHQTIEKLDVKSIIGLPLNNTIPSFNKFFGNWSTLPLPFMPRLFNQPLLYWEQINGVQGSF